MPTLTANIPPEIRGLHRWVCANADSKRPMRAFEAKPASVTKPDTWATFDEAAERVEEGIYEYAGFVFDHDGLVGIDIDRGFGEDGLPTEEALEAILACGSYTEVSKSGKGFHIVCKGELPFGGRNNREGWEVYREGRYFVLTGQVVMFGAVSEAQEGIDLVLARHFAPAEAPGKGVDGRPRGTIWRPSYELPEGRALPLCPSFEPVASGGRHISLVSFCGQVHHAGAHRDTLLAMARSANERYMRPPLDASEVAQVVESVSRYRR